jgi:hypothetical protein
VQELVAEHSANGWVLHEEDGTERGAARDLRVHGDLLVIGQDDGSVRIASRGGRLSVSTDGDTVRVDQSGRLGSGL